MNENIVDTITLKKSIWILIINNSLWLVIMVDGSGEERYWIF